MRQDEAISLQKAILWEQAKGLLRAVVAASGARRAEYDPGTGVYVPNRAWEEGGRAVEAFIKKFEDDGLHE